MKKNIQMRNNNLNLGYDVAHIADNAHKAGSDRTPFQNRHGLLLAETRLSEAPHECVRK